MKETFINYNPTPKSVTLIKMCNSIIREYAEQGFDLTLRQLYYQLVARDVIPNKQRAYNNLGSLVNNARLGGFMDWSAIVDRTRFIRKNSHWDGPADIVKGAAEQFRVDLWENQPRAVEVWIEKDALIGVISGVCEELDVNHFSCRGYVSQSMMYRSAQRIAYREKPTTIIHLGDHDPSGIDMTRDIFDRIDLLSGGGMCEIDRIALTMEQIERENPPPNPAKLSDSRASGYVAEYGYSSWELDALSPMYMSKLIRDKIEGMIDYGIWDEDLHRQDEGRKAIKKVADTL